MSAAGAPRGGAAEGRVRHQARGGFWLAGAMEKALKALVTRHTRAIPPFIHDRVRLADQAAIPLADEQRDLSPRLILTD